MGFNSMKAYVCLTFYLIVLVSGQTDEIALYRKICLDPNSDHEPGVFFREPRIYSKDDCRSVVSCSNGGLSFLRCPVGLHFDVEEQTCQWANEVENCDLAERNKVNSSCPYCLLHLVQFNGFALMVTLLFPLH